MREYFAAIGLTTTYTTNLVNPGTTTGGTNGGSGLNLMIIIRHVRILNVTVSNATYRLFVGATGANTAGTEFMGYNNNVVANDSVDWYGELTLTTSLYLVGGASAGSALTINVEGELKIQ